MLTKKEILINALANVAGTVYGVLQVIIYLYLFFMALTNGFLWFLFMLFIGLTLFQVIFNLLQLPFVLIPAFFVIRIEKIKLSVDSNNKEKNIDYNKPNLLVRLSAFIFGIFSVAFLFLWLNSPDYSNIWFLIYSLGCAYIPLSIFSKKVSILPTLIISIWVLLDQIKLIFERPLHALIAIIVVVPVAIYAWKNTQK